jgi:membrane protein
MKDFVKRLAGFLAFVARRFNHDRCLQIAGSLTYTTLLSLVPLFTIVVAVMSSLPFFEKVMVDIKIFLLLNLVPEIAYKIITVYMGQFAANAARMTYFGLAALFAMTIAMLYTVDKSFNIIWRVQRARPAWVSAIGYVLVLALAPLFLGANVSLTSFLLSLAPGKMGAIPHAGMALLKVLSVAGSTLTFFLVYRLVPCRHVSGWHAFLGALAAALLFETMKHLFGIYIALVPTYDLVYGAFAAIPVFLLWIFLCWTVILLGAEMTASLAYWKGATWRRAGKAETHLHDALLVLRSFIARHAAGGTITLPELRKELPIAADRIEDILDLLKGNAVIERLPGMQTKYRLLKAPETLTLADVYRLFVLSGHRPGDGLESELAPLMAQIMTAFENGMQQRLSEVFPARRGVAETGITKE